MRPRRLLPLLAALTLVAALPAGARADGDPASDILPSAPVYFPYTPKVSKDVRQELLQTVRSARQKGQRIKVALIATLADLGVVTSLNGKPQRYAQFLTSELSSLTRVRDAVLVVTPQGFGLAAAGKPLSRAPLARVKITGSNSDALARSAIAGVRALAKAKGVSLPAASADNGESSGGHTGLVLVAGIGGLLLVALAIWLIVSGVRAGREAAAAASEDQ